MIPNGISKYMPSIHVKIRTTGYMECNRQTKQGVFSDIKLSIINLSASATV